jgi:hypothetical protein
MNWIEFGFGHDTHRKPGKGQLAWFCPACEQPGINVPEKLPNKDNG